MRQVLAVVGAAVLILSCSGEAAEVFSDAMAGIGGAMVDAGVALRDGGSSVRDAGRPVASAGDSGSHTSGPSYEFIEAPCDHVVEDGAITTWYARVEPFDPDGIVAVSAILCGRETWGTDVHTTGVGGKDCIVQAPTGFDEHELIVNCGIRGANNGSRRRTAKITIIRQ